MLLLVLNCLLAATLTEEEIEAIDKAGAQVPPKPLMWMAVSTARRFQAVICLFLLVSMSWRVCAYWHQ